MIFIIREVIKTGPSRGAGRKHTFHIVSARSGEEAIGFARDASRYTGSDLKVVNAKIKRGVIFTTPESKV